MVIGEYVLVIGFNYFVLIFGCDDCFGVFLVDVCVFVDFVEFGWFGCIQVFVLYIVYEVLDKYFIVIGIDFVDQDGEFVFDFFVQWIIDVVEFEFEMFGFFCVVVYNVEMFFLWYG